MYVDRRQYVRHRARGGCTALVMLWFYVRYVNRKYPKHKETCVVEIPQLIPWLCGGAPSSVAVYCSKATLTTSITDTAAGNTVICQKSGGKIGGCRGLKLVVYKI